MDDDMKEYYKAAQSSLQSLGQANPNAMKGFQNFMGAAKKDGALSAKVKELIGIALSVAHQCKFCVAWHVKHALDKGATREEIIEATMIAGTLGGGPSLMFSKYVFKALEDFEK
ncbi:MAG: carboxymuconolactone decarboxylase family protein [Promethearchaeota archaeon]|nr:MAG: carboxymuconolactone decarboxylase family protein [Candidatus Lokiarchaeota archaeon]